MSPCAAFGMHERLPAEAFALAGATVGYDAPEAAEGAAFLAEKLSRILGAEVVTGATGRIVFERADFADTQQYEITTSPTCAKLRASGALGFTAAAADFLHATGYRCFAPHAAWEILPKSAPATVTRGVRESPDYRTRAIVAWLWPEFRKDAFERTWRIANRIGGERVNTGHSYEAFIRENREFLKAHPECLALVGGARRGPKLCVSNALLRSRFVEWSIARARKSPGALSVSVEPSDGGGWCKCADCAKIGSPTDQAVTLANAVAVALRRENLGVVAGLYAYNHHSPPPSVAVEPNVLVSVATGFLTGGWTPEKLVAAWSEKAKMIGIRDYYYSGPLPGERQNANSRQVSHAVKAYHRLGARWMTASSTDGWVGGLVGFNLASRLLWDVDADPAEIRADLVARAFPTAGDAASEFLSLIDGASRRPACEDLFARLYEALDVVWRRVQAPTADERERERVREFVAWTRFEEMLFDYYAEPGEEKARAMLELAAALKPYRALPTYEWFRDGRPLGKPGKALANSFEWNSPRALPEPGATIAAGLAANKKLSFTPIEFSSDAALHADPGAKGMGSVGALRSAHSFYIWSDGRPFDISITGGLISRYRNRGNVSVSLWQIGGASDTGELETEVWKDASVPPDGTNRVVRAVPRNPGLHRLDVYDGGDQTRYGFPTNLPVAIYVKQARSQELRGDYFFHVPAGTRSLGFYANAWTGHICTPGGKAARNLRKLRGHYTVEVPTGMDGKTWSVRGLRGVFQPLTAPPWLNLNPRLMLYPDCPDSKR